MQKWNSVDTLLQDLRYGLRGLRKNPGFTVVAITTLALGIGATTAIFTVVNGVLLRPLPYPHPEELVYVQEILKGFGATPFAGNREFVDWRNQSRTFATTAAYMFSWFNLTGGGEAERVTSGLATASFFPLLGVRPLAGRLFLPGEDRPGGPAVVILSAALWRRRYNSDPAIVGKSITLDDKVYTVVGVLPTSFVIPDQEKIDYALWAPLIESDTGTGPFHIVRVVGRLKPAVSLEASRADLNTILRSTRAGGPEGWVKGVVLSRWQDQVTEKSRLSLLLFLGAVGFLLLIACANVANLLLSRATSRHKEVAIRLTVGAGRIRVVRQLLTESTLLALLGGLLGLILAHWGKNLLVAFISPNLPALEPIVLDYRVLGFSLGLAVLTGLAFGMVPAFQASKVALSEVLKESSRSASESRSGLVFRNLLVIGETALAMVLLVGAGLLFRSFLRARGIDMGFQSSHTLTLTIDLTLSKYPTPRDQARFFEQVIERIKGRAGVQAVGGSGCPPLGNRLNSASGLAIRGQGETIDRVFYATISSDYFLTLEIPLRAGRFFEGSDREGSPSVAIVNEAFARRYCPHGACLERKVQSWVHKDDWLTIVGVVGDVRGLGGVEKDTEPEMYLPYLQAPEPYMTLLVRTMGNPLRLAAAVRGQITSVDKDQPPHDISTLDELREGSFTSRRVNMLLVGVFAALGLILASVGIYGVVSYSVSQRTHEMGVRMALGAERGDVLKIVVGQGLRSVLVGTGVGVAASLGLTRFLQTMLFGVKPTDPLTIITVSLVLLVVAWLACYIPARRATKVDPIVALRYE